MNAKTPKAERKRIANKAARTRKKNRQKRIAKGAARINILSEEKFVDRLRKKGFLAFRTGKAEGLPDIIAYKGRNLSFYEIKPAYTGSSSKSLLMKTQSDWIKKYCFKNNIEVNLVYYKISRSYKYYVVPISKANIRDYEDNSDNRFFIRSDIEDFSFK